jgi:hypothetical protein
MLQFLLRVRSKRRHRIKEEQIMVRQTNIGKTGSLPGNQQSSSSRPGVDTPAKRVHIPALYMRPLGDREFQGCLKSRA